VGSCLRVMTLVLGKGKERKNSPSRTGKKGKKDNAYSTLEKGRAIYTKKGKEILPYMGKRGKKKSGTFSRNE